MNELSSSATLAPEPAPKRALAHKVLDLALCVLPLVVGLVAIVRIPATTTPGFYAAAAYVRGAATPGDLVIVIGAPIQDAGAALRGVPFVVAGSVGHWPGFQRYFVLDARNGGAQLQTPALDGPSNERVFARVRVTEHRMKKPAGGAS